MFIQTGGLATRMCRGNAMKPVKYEAEIDDALHLHPRTARCPVHPQAESILDKPSASQIKPTTTSTSLREPKISTTSTTAITATPVLNDAEDNAVVVYTVVPTSGIILAISTTTSWVAFAEENDADEHTLVPSKVVGRSVFEFMAPNLASFYRQLFCHIAALRMSRFVFQWFCDSPTVRRKMLMSIQPLNDDTLLVTSQQIDCTSHDASVMTKMRFIEPSSHVGDKVGQCAMCLRFQSGLSWVDPGEYSKLKSHVTKFTVASTLCEHCIYTCHPRRLGHVAASGLSLSRPTWQATVDVPFLASPMVGHRTSYGSSSDSPPLINYLTSPGPASATLGSSLEPQHSDTPPRVNLLGITLPPTSSTCAPQPSPFYHELKCITSASSASALAACTSSLLDLSRPVHPPHIRPKSDSPMDSEG